MTPSKTQLGAATAVTGALLLGAGVWTQSRLGASLLPHSFCITASPPLLWLHLASDGLIALAYLLIPWTMWNFIRQRQDMPFGWIALLFGTFIVACGVTHAMEVWTLWYPVYWYSGVAKAFTAAVSLATAWMLFKLVPELLALPSSKQLLAVNRTLELEIAARRQAEAQLTRAKAELELLLSRTTAQAQRDSAVLDRFFEVAPLGLAVLDHELRFLRVNPALPQVTGRPSDDYLESRFDKLPQMPVEALDAVREVVRTRLAGPSIEIARKEGTRPRHWRANFFPIELPNGSCLFGCVVQDISYRREVERQREEALAAAEEANRSKDQFLAKVSHELRSPLQVALSAAEVLKRTPDLPPQARKFVDRLGHAIAMQARMINDLLDLSRILSGKLHIVKEAIDPVVPLLRTVEHATANATAQSRGVALDVSQLHTGQALVEADAARLEQVYGNLIENAVRFSPDGARVVIGAQAGQSRWRFFVRDFGTGMSATEVQSVFEPFAQGSAQPASGKGLGLGLAIVKSLVEAFDGRVWAESAGPGHGCTFVVELPLLAGSALPSSDFGEMRVAPRLDGVRILYVEDEGDVATAMQEGLTRLGARVDVATSYDEACDKLQRLPLDIVITDLNLGQGLTGQDVAKAMRAIPRHASVPVIAVSAFGTREDVESTQEAGFADHLIKPVDAATIADAVWRWTRSRA